MRCPSRFPPCLDDGGPPGLVDAREDLRPGGRGDGVHRHLDVSLGRVLEPDGHGEAAGQLTVDLALRGAGSDRPPAHRVGQVLRV